MTEPTESQDSNAPRTLATAGLPRRVRRILERALALYSEELERNLVTAISEFEEELFRLADRAGTTGSSMMDHMQTLRVVRLNRHDLVPRFMMLLESGLAGLNRPLQTSVARPASTATPLNFRNLSLVDNSVMDEGAVLHEIAVRQESRCNLVLHLLGQRFGVLAGAPAFDSERLPLGPQALCRAIRHASEVLHLEQETRLLFYRLFDRRVMSQCQSLSEKLDALMVEEGVLPSLTYVPMRTRVSHADEVGGDADDVEDTEEIAAGRPAGARRSGGQTPYAGGQGGGNGAGNGGHGGAPGGMAGGGRMGGGAMSGGGSPGQGTGGARGPGMGGGDGHGGHGSYGGYDPQRPHTGWIGQPAPATYSSFSNVDEQAAYEDLSRLLATRQEQRDQLNPVPPGQRPEAIVSTRDILQGLGRMAAEPESPGGTTTTLADIRQSLLAQARQQHGKPVALSQTDNDTFELVGLLYNHLQSDIRGDAPAAALVRRLQTTLLRVALQDRAFFVRPSHPARQLLNTVSETAAKWLADDDIDPQLLAPLQDAVTHAVKHYDGDASVFEESNRRLQGHIDTQVKRAEALERRHVEAARGKEKLEVAKQNAEQALAGIIGDRELPKFSRALLNQSWVDVLTLTQLRHGEGSQEWERQIDATRRIVDACARRGEAEEDGELKQHVESALKLVGYHDEEADVIARRLSSSAADDSDDAASRTELTMKLKARVRLGEDAARARNPDLPPRTPQEQEFYEQLRLLPFGTWLEFVTNQQGDVVRRRMSWFSPVTGHALFVNQRGQRVGEHSLDSLARMMARDQLRVVTQQRASLVDRAWQAAMSALRSLTGRGGDSSTDAPSEQELSSAAVSVPARHDTSPDEHDRPRAVSRPSSGAPDGNGGPAGGNA